MPAFQHFRDWILLVVCNLIWASQFVLVKIVQEQMGPIATTTIPMAIATLMLIPIVRFESRRDVKRSDNWRADWLHFLLIGVLGQVTAQLCITWGLRYSLASNAAVLMLALPIVTAFMAFLILKEKMSAVRWFSFALAIGGIAECSGVDWRSLNLVNVSYLVGNLLIVLSVCGSAFYNVYSKKLLVKYSPLQVLLYSYYFVIVCLLPVNIVAEPETLRQFLHYTAHTWIGIALLAFFQYFLSMVIFLTVLQRLDAIQASLSNYLIPFFGLVIAALVLHEKLTASMVAGGMLVLLSTLLITVYEDRKAIREALVRQNQGAGAADRS